MTPHETFCVTGKPFNWKKKRGEEALNDKNCFKAVCRGMKGENKSDCNVFVNMWPSTHQQFELKVAFNSTAS